jgi:hypothetical protein
MIIEPLLYSLEERKETSFQRLETLSSSPSFLSEKF